MSVIRKATPLIKTYHREEEIDSKFWLRNSHAIIKQVHRIVDVIKNALEGRYVRHYSFLIFWKRNLPKKYSDILILYITITPGRQIPWIKIHLISISGPILYLLLTYHTPQLEGIVMAIFADTAILSVAENAEESTRILKRAIEKVHINFTNKNIILFPININEKIVSYSETAKYLGMT